MSIGSALYPHNQKAYRRLCQMLSSHDRAAIVQPTGTGKTLIAAQYLADHPNLTAVWATPSRTITNSQFKTACHIVNGFDPDNVNVKTYTRLMLDWQRHTQQTVADIIILDEFHHCGAMEWGNGVSMLLKANPKAKIIGLSATPKRFSENGRDMTDELFDGNIASYMTLNEAWRQRILPVPTYVICGYVGAQSFGLLQSRTISYGTTEAKNTFAKLRSKVVAMKGLQNMFDKYLPENARILVFCSDIAGLEKARRNTGEWFGDNARAYAVHSRYGSPDRELRLFREDSKPGRSVLYSVDMLNEGVHLDGVDAIVMLRATKSPIVYLQQLGRALDAASNKAALVFDVSDNYSSVGFTYAAKGAGSSTLGQIPDVPDLDNVHIVDEYADVRRLVAQLEHELGMTMDGKIDYIIQHMNDRNGS